MTSKAPSSRRVNAVENAFAIVEFLAESDGATLTEIADEVGLAKSTTHSYLVTMLDREYLVEDANTYRLGLKFLAHGRSVVDGFEAEGIVEDVLKDVVAETEEIAWFVVEEHGRAVFLEKATGERAVQPYGRIGKRTSLHAIAAGKAILAYLPEERVEEIVERRGLDPQTDRTITDRETLAAELAEIRERGYALNRSENVEGWRAVASPVIQNGEVFGAIATSGPENRMQGDRFTETIPQIVSGAANEVQLRLMDS